MHQTKTHLSKLLRKALRGEEVIIARGKKPVAKLVSLEKPTKKRVPGRWKGKIRIHPSFFAPMTAEQLAEWGLE